MPYQMMLLFGGSNIPKDGLSAIRILISYMGILRERSVLICGVMGVDQTNVMQRRKTPKRKQGRSAQELKERMILSPTA